jgi:hypothetical protein
VEGIHFPYLKQLGLEDVSISEGLLHTIISSCPVLECLLLKDIFGFGCLRISSNSLRSIDVGADRRRDNLQFLHEVIIVDAPCLERFLYLGNPMNLTVISAPKLETLGCLNDEWFHGPRPTWPHIYSGSHGILFFSHEKAAEFCFSVIQRFHIICICTWLDVLFDA